MLTKSEVDLVQADWEKVSTIADTAATLFYKRLFEVQPKLEQLFPDDLTEQKKKLMSTIGVAVHGLTDLAAIVPALQMLGRKHVAYGVKPEDYGTVGSALLWTLKAGLGDGFDAEHEAAWTKVYGVLSKTMIDASASSAVAAGN